MKNILENSIIQLNNKIVPSTEQINKADAIYKEIVSSLLSLVDNDKNLIDIIKQGSYKNRTLTTTRSNKFIDLDILVGFRGKYDHADKAKTAIANNLRARGFEIVAKTRVIQASKNGFKVDILPAIVSPYLPDKYLIREKGTTNQKTIDPNGFIKWMQDRKREFAINQYNASFVLNRKIDKEGYNKKMANANINIAIRVVKSMAYEFKKVQKKEGKPYITSHFIETIFVDSFNGFGNVSDIISQGLMGIEEFASNGKNFYNPSYENEIIIRYENKSVMIDFIRYVRDELKKLRPNEKSRIVSAAGVVLTIAAAASSISATANRAPKIIPLHSRETKWNAKVDRHLLRNTNAYKGDMTYMKIMESIAKLKKAKIKPTERTLISSNNKHFAFEIFNIAGRKHAKPLFDVKDNFHMYQDNIVCLGKVMPSEYDFDLQLANWVEAYVVYIQFGFSGYPETKHKTFEKNIFVKKGK